MKNKLARTSLFVVLGVLFITILACKQAGEIVPDAEATQRAIPTTTPTLTIQEAVDAEFSDGDEIVFTGRGYLIPIFQNPGDQSVLSHVARGDSGTIVSSILFEGEVWYEVKSVAGDGWAPAESIQAPE
ncbi:MAG: hypothetical protein L3J16_00555 [Anaerolineales bacterium]|nr:hypothetical protein [Anaerolineales bacterium]